jgi:hypothetical protein
MPDHSPPVETFRLQIDGSPVAFGSGLTFDTIGFARFELAAFATGPSAGSGNALAGFAELDFPAGAPGPLAIDFDIRATGTTDATATLTGVTIVAEALDLRIGLLAGAATGQFTGDDRVQLARIDVTTGALADRLAFDLRLTDFSLYDSGAVTFTDSALRTGAGDDAVSILAEAPRRFGLVTFADNKIRLGPGDDTLALSVAGSGLVAGGNTRVEGNRLFGGDGLDVLDLTGIGGRFVIDLQKKLLLSSDTFGRPDLTPRPANTLSGFETIIGGSEFIDRRYTNNTYTSGDYVFTNRFLFQRGHGDDVITDFNAPLPPGVITITRPDIIAFQGIGRMHDFDSLLARATDTAEGVLIATDGIGSTLLLEGLTRAGLRAEWFDFGG